MKEFITFLTACVVLGIAQSLVAALSMALLIFAFMGALSHPRETFGFVFCLGMLILALHVPIACVAALGAIGIAVVITGQAKKRQVPKAKAPPPLLAAN